MLDIRHLEVAYGHARVIHDLNLTLAPGEMVFIVGRNGAGKTTLLKTIAGLLKPTQGEIVFDGRSVAEKPPKNWRAAAFDSWPRTRRSSAASRCAPTSSLPPMARGSPSRRPGKKR